MKILFSSLIIAALLVAVLSDSTATKADVETIMSVINDRIESESFRIKAKDTQNFRGYYFEVKEQNVRCIFVAGTKKGGLSCDWK